MPLVRDNHCELHILVPRKNILGAEIYEREVADYEIVEGVHVHRVPKVSNMAGAIRRICKKVGIDIVHAHNPRFGFLSLLALVNKPLIVEIHALPQLSPIKEFLARITYRLCDRIVVLANPMKEEVTRRYGIRPNKVEVVYNGVEIGRFAQQDEISYRKEKYHAAERFVVGYIGTFYKWQGTEDLVRAFSIVVNKRDDVRLLMVGDGPDFNTVRDIVSQLDIGSKVVLTGKVPPDEVPSYLGQMDAFVVPRPSVPETETAVPLKVLEAMAAGKAIVATNVGGLTDVIEDGVNGILTEPGNISQLADRILDLINDQSLRKKIGEQARQKAREYDWDHSAMIMLTLYKQLSGRC
jgi:glycosyltransferase involved in cell wall biosynthesis